MKKIIWMGSSLRDLKRMPMDVCSTVGFALYMAQLGLKHELAKPLKGFNSAGVLEVVESFEGNAYRAVYTVKLQGVIYVLHCFQKKSTKGISTPKPEIELIKSRLRDAESIHKESNHD